MMRALLVLIVAAASASSAVAGDLRELCPNRPGKGTPPCILDAGHWQVETDLADVSRDRAAGVRTDDSSVADFQLRYGLNGALEIQAAWAPFLTERTKAGAATSHQSGAGDLTLALRQALTAPDREGPSVSVQPFAVAPTGAHGFGAAGWQEGVILPVAVPVTNSLSFNVSPEVDLVRNTAGGGTHPAYAAAAGLSEALGPVTLGFEVWERRDEDPAGHTRLASVDLSAAWTPKSLPDLQLDVGLNAAANRSTPDREWYVGLARRF